MVWLLTALGVIGVLAGVYRTGRSRLVLPHRQPHRVLDAGDLSEAQSRYFEARDAELARLGFAPEITVASRAGGPGQVRVVHRYYVDAARRRHLVLSALGGEFGTTRSVAQHAEVQTRYADGRVLRTANPAMPTAFDMPEHVLFHRVPPEVGLSGLLEAHEDRERQTEGAPADRPTSLEHLDREYATFIDTQLARGLLHRPVDDPYAVFETARLRLRRLAAAFHPDFGRPGELVRWAAACLAPPAFVLIIGLLTSGSAIAMTWATVLAFLGFGLVVGGTYPADAVLKTLLYAGLPALGLVVWLHPGLHPLALWMAGILMYWPAKALRQRREAPRFELATGHETKRIERAQGQLSAPTEDPKGQLSPGSDDTA